jgi:hypothetical protein
MATRTGLMIALICIAWSLMSCGKPEPDRFVITGPVVHPPMQPIWQKVNLTEPPESARAPRWKPGDPIIVPGDFDFPTKGPGARKSWFRHWLQRVCSTMGSENPAPAESPVSAPEPVKVTEGLAFNGIPSPGYKVPDPVGDIGPDHYVQAVNSAFQVFKTDGTALTTDPLLINYLWHGKESHCSTENPRDPIVRYDKQADRWLISGFVTPSKEEYMCIAVSQTPDPTSGLWFLYEFKAADPATLKLFSIDFPKLSVWPDAYYLSTIERYDLGLDVWALERSQMLAGQPARMVRFHLPKPGIALLPGDPDGNPPPAGSPAWFARQLDDDRESISDDRVEVYRFSVDWVNTGNSSFTEQNTISVEPFDSLFCLNDDFDICVPQKDTPQKLETLSAMPQWRLQYRNMGDHESLLFNHTIDTDGQGHAGIRWYELRRPGNGDWAVHQYGTLKDHNQDQPLNYFMGSIAMDGNGNIALGYSASSADVYPGIRIAHRMAGDGPGSMPGVEYLAVSGSGSQTGNDGRWGDYSTMDVDPDDDCTFWYTHEYYEVSSVAGWLTRIISFRLPGCDGATGVLP